MQSQKTTEWSLCFQGKPFNSTVIQVYTPTSNAEEAEVEWFHEDLEDLWEVTPKKGILFIRGDWNAKVGSQEIPRVTGKFCLGVHNESAQMLIKFSKGELTGHSKHTLPTTQEKTWWSISKSDWLYFFAAKMEKLYTASKNKTGSWLWHRPWTPYCQIQT